MDNKKLVCEKGCKDAAFLVVAIEHHTVEVSEDGDHIDSIECYDYQAMLGVGDSIECKECGGKGAWK